MAIVPVNHTRHKATDFTVVPVDHTRYNEISLAVILVNHTRENTILWVTTRDHTRHNILLFELLIFLITQYRIITVTTQISFTTILAYHVRHNTMPFAFI